MRKIRIGTVAYGEPFVGFFHRSLMRSLMQPGNLPALLAAGREIEHLVVTTAADRERLELTEPIDGYTRLLVVTDNPRQVFFNRALTACVEDGAILLMASADFFFADGAVANIIAYNADRHLCLAGCHIRVNDEEFLASLLSEPVSSGQLVRLSMDHAHAGTKNAFLENDFNNSYMSATFFQQISRDLYTANQRNAPIMLASIDEKDVEYFATAPPFWPGGDHFGNWDWAWPSDVLIPANRYKFLAASDLFLIAELTRPASADHAGQNRGGMRWNDEFQFSNKVQFGIQRTLVSTLRAE